MRFLIDGELRGRVFVGLGIVVNVDNVQYPHGLQGIIDEVIGLVRTRYTLDGLRDDPVIRAYRDFYWHELGIDPTKQRPAQEALLRRVLRGEGLPRINPMVDIGNVASIRYLVPIGLYDLDKVGMGDLVIRRAREGEVFRPIGSSPRQLTSNQLVLATSSGKILHVYPYRDSEETKVTEETRKVLIVAAGVPGASENNLLDAVSFIEELARSLLGGVVVLGPVLVRDEAVLNAFFIK